MADGLDDVIRDLKGTDLSSDSGGASAEKDDYKTAVKKTVWAKPKRSMSEHKIALEQAIEVSAHFGMKIGTKVIPKKKFEDFVNAHVVPALPDHEIVEKKSAYKENSGRNTREGARVLSVWVRMSKRDKTLAIFEQLGKAWCQQQKQEKVLITVVLGQMAFTTGHTTPRAESPAFDCSRNAIS